MSSDFASRENKELLWNVLYENSAFDGIPKENVMRVQELFEQSILSMETKDTDLVALNKNFIGGFIQKIDGFKKRSVPLAHGRKEQVNTEFQNKQQELTRLLNPKPPSDIDFSDSDDKPLDSKKIDDILEATIRQRELDLEISHPVGNNTEHKWLSGEKAGMEQSSRNIKIGDEIKTDASQLECIDSKPTKKVAWADEQNTVLPSEVPPLQNNFFQKLKPKPSVSSTSLSSELSDRLKNIEDKMSDMCDMLKQLTEKGQQHRD